MKLNFSCNLGILKNRIDYFSVETSFCQFSNMASSGLRVNNPSLNKNIGKNVYLRILCTHKSVSVNVFLAIFGNNISQ